MSYASLQEVFDKAFLQASSGKGKDRHANNDSFVDQPIFWIEREFKSFQLGQAVKKIHESQRLPTERAVAELYGAIVFIASHIIFLENNAGKE
jgi:hypothetical protein